MAKWLAMIFLIISSTLSAGVSLAQSSNSGSGSVVIDRARQALGNGDSALAMAILLKGAEEGESPAQTFVAALLLESSNYEDGIFWLNAAADQGDPDAFHLLGLVYANGMGVDVDPKIAGVWFTTAALAGHRDAQAQAAGSYLVGDVTPPIPDYAAGLYWAALASANGDTLGTRLLNATQSELSKNCADAMSMGPETRERFCVNWADKELARLLEPRFCDKVNVVDGTLRDQFKLYKGAATGQAQCAYHLGMKRYILAFNNRALDWFYRAAVSGHRMSQYMLGSMYADGRATDAPANTTTQRRNFWLAIASQNGVAEASRKCADYGINCNASPYKLTRANLAELGYRPNAKVPIRSYAETQPTIAPGDIILGTWEQYALIDGRYMSLGRFYVSKSNSAFEMTPLQQINDPDFTNSVGIHSVFSDGKDWIFVSEWGGDRRGEFRLTRTSDTEFQGAVWVNGAQSTPNRWLKVE